jgi:hypothetical protein
MLSSTCSSKIDTYATESAKKEVRLMIVPGKKGFVVNCFNTIQSQDIFQYIHLFYSILATFSSKCNIVKQPFHFTHGNVLICDFYLCMKVTVIRPPFLHGKGELSWDCTT